MNELKLFSNPEFGSVRAVELDDGPWFVGKDVATILGYANPNEAIIDHVDEDDKFLRGTRGSEMLKLFRSLKEMQDELGRQDNWFINESGVYALVFGSHLPSAKAFKHWVTHEVLPAIRKTGGYHVPQSPAEQMAQGILAAQKLLAERDATIAKQNEQIAVLTPKGIFADAVATSDTCILIGALAKLIKQNGIDIGQKRLFAWMRENGYLIKSGNDKNMPTQRAMEMKLFEVKEGSYVDGNGVNKTTRTTKVTGKRQQYFINKFLAEKEAAEGKPEAAEA